MNQLIRLNYLFQVFVKSDIVTFSNDIPPLLDDSGPHPNVVIDKIIQDEMNNRLNVYGGMGNNITLISSTPIGIGTIGFVLAG